MSFSHASVEKNVGLMMVLILLLVSVGGLVEIVPLFFQKSTTEPVAGLKPYNALQLTGRDVYVREYVASGVEKATFHASDPRLERLFEAGRRKAPLRRRVLWVEDIPA